MRAVSIAGLIVALTSSAEAQPAPPPPHEPCALVVVVDRSRSMRGDKLDAVKNAVVDVLDTLDPSDRIAVVGFARKAKVFVPLQPVGNRRPIAAALGRLRAGDGANVVSGLETASRLLRDSTLQRKRVLVITDGDMLLGVRRAAGALFGSGVTVSAVGLQSLNRAAVNELADAGHGRAIALEDLTELPSILVSETTIASVFDPRAVVFVIDRSGSMQGDKLEAAKEAVRASIEVLASTDLVAVVAFDTQAAVAVPLQRVANRTRISTEVTRITAGGGTSLYAGLEAAAAELVPANVAVKHVIVLTDGESPSDGIADLVARMAGRDTTISSVGVAGADRDLLSVIADAGHGRLYMVDDLAGLPKLFIGELQHMPR